MLTQSAMQYKDVAQLKAIQASSNTRCSSKCSIQNVNKCNAIQDANSKCAQSNTKCNTKCNAIQDVAQSAKQYKDVAQSNTRCSSKCKNVTQYNTKCSSKCKAHVAQSASNTKCNTSNAIQDAQCNTRCSSKCKNRSNTRCSSSAKPAAIQNVTQVQCNTRCSSKCKAIQDVAQSAKQYKM
ncbi:unnamed protein product [Mytilus edulis]|uniref:Uncharacterized protein n=1 Tax=Mytilus edulis TaxID=6550 RepID=A0A8S3UEJ7_MYTED|nr:unnamed protein product [Mytilus edulis]